MADFNIAQLKTGHIEGGYANDPQDKGGETAFGLTRRDWPNWSGWAVIDRLKAQYGLSKAIPVINSNVQLKSSAIALFKANYWDVNRLSEINDQQIANQIYDADINQGVGMGAKFLQEAAGVTVDLHVGKNTLAAVNAGDPKTIYDKIIALRKARYDAIIAANPSQEKFKASWYSRIKDAYVPA